VRSVCIFSHYYDLNLIPYYVLIYIKELKRHFDELVLVTNDRNISNLAELPMDGIKLIKVKNEGYDMGMFYKAYKTLDTSRYSTIACINDSNILFGKLDFLFEWAINLHVDFWGLIDADITPSYSTNKENYHIQSHFLVFNKKAIDLLPSFFDTVDLLYIFGHADLKEVKRKVILEWEIGLSRFFISNGLSAKSYLDHKVMNAEFKMPASTNISLKLYAQLIKKGMPLLKKKIVISINPAVLWAGTDHWKSLIKKYADKNIDTNKLITELSGIRSRHIRNKIL